MSKRIHVRLEILNELVSPQSRSKSLLLTCDCQKSAISLHKVAESYHRLIKVLHQQIEVALLNNRHFVK